MARKKTEGDGEVFAALGLDPRIVQTLSGLGYEEPTPIQREAIPPLLEGRDMVGQAATGTGKTAAFALPLLHRVAALQGDDRTRPSALVLVPTRELAMQVAEAIHRYGRLIGAKVLPIYGGQAYGPQLRALERGIDVVVATPGRALDHIRRETLRLDGLVAVVLDEADEMLDLGFAEDIEAILAETPDERQTMLFSATLPPRIAGIAKRHLTDPVKIEVGREPVASGELPKVRQTAYIVPRAHKLASLGRVLDVESPTAAIVFCRRRDEVDQLTEALNGRGFRAEALHGGMSQEQRTRVMKKFRAGTAELLIATDVAARGLDIEHLSHVVNYDVPSEPESYVHRIGRVGRAGREGVAITLLEPREHRMLRLFEKTTKRKIEVAQLPTLTDLRTRRLELTKSGLREAIVAGDLDQFRVVVASLADEFDVMEVALAAVKLAHRAEAGEEDDQEIPVALPPAADRRPPRERERDRERNGFGGPASGPGRPRRPVARGRDRGRGDDVARLFVGAGRNAGIRPQDLVGAIAGEADIPGRDIGAIEIADRFSLVEVPEGVAELVITALRGTKIKGKRVIVRRDRGER